MYNLPVLTITESKPVPILNDFLLFTDYLKNNKIVLTKANEYISRVNLHQINQMMANPVKDNTERSEQPSYPLLHLFYNLIIAGNFFRKVPAKGGRLALEPTERCQMYDARTLTEKYFFLLETLWVDVDWDKLDTSYFRSSWEYTVPTALSFLSEQMPGQKIYIKNCNTLGPESAFIKLSALNLIFSYFGFWQVTRDESIADKYPKSHFSPEAIIPTYLGVMMAPILTECRPLRLWNLPIRRLYGEWNVIPGSPLPQENADSIIERSERRLGRGNVRVSFIRPDESRGGEDFYRPFAPFFKTGELENTLPRKNKGNRCELVDGTFIFKVSFQKNVWRRIEMAARHNLEDLHIAIQEAFDFGNDHLYCFFMDNKLWSHERFTSPDDDEGPFANEVRIGELDLMKCQKILYLFDYGDEWTFTVELEDISQNLPIPLKPRIIEKKGKSPKQYPYYDD